MDIEIKEGDVVGSTYQPKTDEEIKELAIQLYRGEIFTSLQIKKHDITLLPNIFLPLALMDDLSRRLLIVNRAYCFYANMKDSGPHAINGYPCFFSFSYLNEEDTYRVIDKYDEIKKVVGDV